MYYKDMAFKVFFCVIFGRDITEVFTLFKIIGKFLNTFWTGQLSTVARTMDILGELERRG